MPNAAIGSSEKLIENLNRTVVTAAEMLELAEAVGALEPEQRTFEGHAFAASRLHEGNHQKVSALMFRMEATARLLFKAGGAPGWAFPAQPDGSMLTHEAVFAAAAAQPLVLIGGQPGFEREAFLQKALELARLDTHS
jgi:hypothetical protein